MQTVKIGGCSFGTIVIDGRTYTDDLFILPDGKIVKPWRRKRGHQLTMDDLGVLIDSAPETIVVGTGVSGGVKTDKDLNAVLGTVNIEFIAKPNKEAIKLFNRLASEKRVGAGFHLTC